MAALLREAKPGSIRIGVMPWRAAGDASIIACQHRLRAAMALWAEAWAAKVPS